MQSLYSNVWFVAGNVEPHREWPGHGEIVLENLSTRYAPDLPAVLREVDLRIKPGEKVIKAL